MPAPTSSGLTRSFASGGVWGSAESAHGRRCDCVMGPAGRWEGNEFRRKPAEIGDDERAERGRAGGQALGLTPRVGLGATVGLRSWAFAAR